MGQNRRLIIIPIVHTHADFGSLDSRMLVDKEIEALKTQYWNGVLAFVQNLAFSKVRVYQDGLPDTSEENISLILSKAQTPNYDVVRWLKDRGAHIVGTEDMNLLVKEYNLFKATQSTSFADEDQFVEARLRYAEEAPVLSKQRIDYIAQRIRDTLPEGGTGILFIGLAHEIKKELANEMDVVEPRELIGSTPETLRKKSGIEKL